ncbi:alkaline phosphatase family protein [Halorubrum salinarum]|uniref:Alkaline phosphatase family protein n=1 Tax=Halorubrum salinarum TaxID=2739057 RepID=A0A7D3YLB3_9EURY|nr:alkaline phosphatase family protein [Halorubrum salinarum]QKG92046.1 alkaline phosphatase family protein [Halorubrum salinarum]
MTNPKTVVFGLDGAHFELIEPWLEAGHLPNINSVISTGVTADLQSVLPPVTSPNWKAYLTGKNPGKIGIYWWENIDTNGQRVYYPSERKNANTEFWELIAEKKQAGIIGTPTTYPPRSGNGFVVAGAPDGKNNNYTSPSELEKQLANQFNYQVTKSHRINVDSDSAVDEILDLIDQRFKAANYLLSEYDADFLQVTTFYLNSLHHFLWDSEHTLTGWQTIDKHLGNYLDEGHNIVLMSDHGSTQIETAFNVNSWLESEGYLTLDTTTSDLLHRLGITTDRLITLASTFGVQNVAERLVPEWILNYVPDDSGELTRESKTENVDWEATTVIASGQGPVYLTVDPSEPRYIQLQTELKEKLESVTDPAGSSIANAVYRGKEIYDGAYIEEAPDLIIDQRPGVHITGGIGREEIFTDPSDDGWLAENKRSGLFAATGPDFSTGEIKDLSILDLAPSFLHLHNCEVPKDMDGEVKRSIFDSNSEARNRQIRYRGSEGQEAERKRIREATQTIDL